MRKLMISQPLYFDEDQNCYAYGDESDLFIVRGSAFDCVSEFVPLSLYFPYSVEGDENREDGFVRHEHSFDDLIAAVIRYGSSFRLPPKYNEYYSDQELSFISKLRSIISDEQRKMVQR